MNSTVTVTTPGDRDVCVTRTLDAPRELVFECHTRPELLTQWLLGPPGWSMPVCEVDFREGGAYRYGWRNDAKGQEFEITGTYREITPPAEIVTLERSMGRETICTLRLEERDGQTTLTQTIRFDSAEARDAALATGMTRGMGQSYDRLAALVARPSA